MNVHIILHSPWYTQRLRQLLQSLEGKPYCVVVIHSFFAIEIFKDSTCRKYSFFQAKKVLRQSEICDVFYHYLSFHALLLIKGLSIKKQTWIVWGADYYFLPTVRTKYYSERSKPYIKTNAIRDFFSKRMLYKAIHDLDFIAANKTDFEEIKKHISTKAVLKDLDNFFHSNHIKERLKGISGDFILIGNSDDPANNHFDGIEKIKNTTRKVIVPLSGVKNKYTEKLKMNIESIFSESQILHEFLSHEAFYKRLEKVETVIFPHLRQQGRGTIMPLLYHGRKVFLFEKNPLYRLFKSWNLIVFSLDNIQHLNRLDIPLSKEEKINNQIQIDTILSEERNKQQWINILS